MGLEEVRVSINLTKETSMKTGYTQTGIKITLHESEVSEDDVRKFYQPDMIPRLMLKYKRKEVIEAYGEITGESDVEHLEGGIDGWIGFGSVTCCELRANTWVSYHDGDACMLIASL